MAIGAVVVLPPLVLEDADLLAAALARYLSNHKGHLMYVRAEETHVTPELAKGTTLSGTREELIDRLRALEAAGYTQVTVQLVHDHEAAIEEWADVFAAV